MPQGLGAAVDHVKPSARGPAPSFWILESRTVWRGGDRPEHIHSPSLPHCPAGEADPVGVKDLLKAPARLQRLRGACLTVLPRRWRSARPTPHVRGLLRSAASPSAPHSCLVGLVTAPSARASPTPSLLGTGRALRLTCETVSAHLQSDVSVNRVCTCK